jgi:hypothetical protein
MRFQGEAITSPCEGRGQVRVDQLRRQRVLAGSGVDDEINVLSLELCIFCKRLKTTATLNPKHMKKLFTLTSIASLGAVLALVAACQTTGAAGGEIARKEALLSQSGFRVITVTTPQQQQAINGIAQGRCSAVKYNGKLFYVFPTATKDKIYVGKQAQFNKYKKAIAAQQIGQPARM